MPINIMPPFNASPDIMPQGAAARPSAASFPASAAAAGLAPCAALIGCDGSGKSTLTRDLVAFLGQRNPTQSVYLGLGTGDLGRKIGELPIIGPIAEQYLTSKAKKAHEGKASSDGSAREGKAKTLPGLMTALVMVGFSLARRRRFRKALKLRRQGIQMVTDRYPQAEIAGSFDGPGLAWTRKGTPLVEWLAAREHALYSEMAAYQPTVVIRLNVDVETALARKADHKREMLEKKLAVVPTLQFRGAPIVDVDATRPYAEVFETVLEVLRRYGMRA